MHHISCDHCGSDNVRSMGVIHAEGNSRGGGATIGVLTNTSGIVGLLPSWASRHSQTDLARQCAPPSVHDSLAQAKATVGASPSWGCIGMLVPVTVIMFCVACSAVSNVNKLSTLAGIFILAAIGAGVWFYLKIIWAGNRQRAWQTKVWDERDRLFGEAMIEYHKMFLCLKCGNACKKAN